MEKIVMYLSTDLHGILIIKSTNLLNKFRKRSGVLDRGSADAFLVGWTVRMICYIGHICTVERLNGYVDER